MPLKFGNISTLSELCVLAGYKIAQNFDGLVQDLSISSAL